MVQEYRSILAPVDGSNQSELAFRKAVAIAKRDQAQLIIAHVIDTKAIQTMSGFDALFTEEVVEQAKSLMDEYAHIARNAGLSEVRTCIEFGAPKVAIVQELVKEYGIDLIIIGATGLNAVERLFLGSVTDYVVHHAGCDVLVVRSDLEDQLLDPDQERE